MFNANEVTGPDTLTWDSVVDAYKIACYCHKYRNHSNNSELSNGVLINRCGQSLGFIYRWRHENAETNKKEVNKMRIDLYSWRAEAKKALDNADYIEDYQNILIIDPHHQEAIEAINNFGKTTSTVCTIS